LNPAAARAYHTDCALAPLTAGMAVAGSLMPDIDRPDSWIGRRLLIIAYPLSLVIKHRGITHSLLMVAMLGVLASIHTEPASLWPIPWAAAFVLGYGVHLLGDAITPQGIPLLWPWKRAFALPPGIRTGSLLEIILVMGFVAGAAFVYAEPIQGLVDGGMARLR
jgi:inner membrane protein